MPTDGCGVHPMARWSRPRHLPRVARVVAGLAIGAAGAAVLSIATSQGFLNASVDIGSGYFGATHPLDALGQLGMVAAWLLIGGVAGFVGRTALAFGGLWVGALAGSIVGFVADPGGNILYLDIIVTVVGIGVFLTPGFLIGAFLAGRREVQDPDGSGRRPTPPPLWARGGRASVAPGHSTSAAASPAPVTVGATSSQGTHPPSAYARPGQPGSE